MKSEATTAEAYLKGLPAEKRRQIEPVRRVILENLPKGYEEMIDYGMLSYVVPLSTLPKTYNGHPLPIAALAAQKNYNSVYLMSIYAHKETQAWFEKAYKASGKKLDMGKSCVRFRDAEDLPLDVIGEAVARVSLQDYVATYKAAKGSKE